MSTVDGTEPPAAESRWDGYYINLDRAEQRRRRTEAELGRYGLETLYRRFPAVDGRTLDHPSPLQPGEVGAFRSHLDIFELVAAGHRPAHVIEDDAVLCDLTAPTVDTVIERGVAGQFDLLFLHTDLGARLGDMQAFNLLFEEVTRRSGPIVSPDQLQILDISDGYVFGLYSYVMTPRGAGRLLPALRQAWQEGPVRPVDVVVKDEAKAGRLRIGCVFPFVTAPDFDSTRANATTQLDRRDAAMIRPAIQYSFFLRRDIAGYAIPALDGALAALGIDATDPGTELSVRVLSLFLQRPDLPLRR